MAQQVLQSRQPPRAVGRFVSRPVVGFEDAFKSGLKEFVLQEFNVLGEVDAVFQAFPGVGDHAVRIETSHSVIELMELVEKVVLDSLNFCWAKPGRLGDAPDVARSQTV